VKIAQRMAEFLRKGMAEEQQTGPRLSPSPWRFSIRTLLIAIAVIAACIPLCGYTLRHASSWVGSLVLFATSMLLAAMACLAFNRTGARRAWWTGCAIFGIAYFVIGGDPWSQPYNYELFTETIATLAYNEFYPEGTAATQPPITEPPQPVPPQPEPIPAPENDEALPLDDIRYSNPPPAVANPPDLRDFVMVAHMYWSLLFAFLGGWVSLVMYWTGQRTWPLSLWQRGQDECAPGREQTCSRNAHPSQSDSSTTNT
jgi:hypothetical protein